MPRTSTSRSIKAPPKWTVRDNNREARIQAACVDYVRLVAPQVLILSIPNTGFGVSPSRLVWMGMRVGACDLLIVDEHTLAYFVEVKDIDGTLSPVQIEFRDECHTRKIPWALVRSVNDMADTLARFRIKTREAK